MTSKWKESTTTPAEHPLIKSQMDNLSNEFIMRIESDMDGLMQDMNITDPDDIMENMGKYFIKNTLSKTRDIIDTEMNKSEANINELTFSYTGKAFLKMTYDKMLVDPTLAKYKHSLIKAFNELTEFPAHISSTYRYVVYDNDLLLGYSHTDDIAKVAPFVGLLLDNLKESIKTESLAKQYTPDTDVKLTFNVIDTAFDTYKQAFLSDDNICLSNLRLLYEYAQYASEIKFHENGKSKSITLKQLSNRFDKQIEDLKLERPSDFLNHISFN